MKTWTSTAKNMFRRLPPEEVEKRKVGLHFHFWNFLSALVPPAILYYSMMNVREEMMQVKANRTSEDKEISRSLLSGKLTENSPEVKELPEERRKEILFNTIIERVSRLERRVVVHEQERMAIRLFHLASSFSQQPNQTHSENEDKEDQKNEEKGESTRDSSSTNSSRKPDESKSLASMDVVVKQLEEKPVERDEGFQAYVSWAASGIWQSLSSVLGKPSSP